MSRTLICIVALFLGVASAHPTAAQMERRRAQPGGPAEEAFWAPTVIGLQSVTQLPAKNANITIMHAFGRVSSGAKELFGLDGAANIRFGLDLGLTDRLSVGVGRSRFDKQYDARLKLSLLRQTRDDRVPVSISYAGTAAVLTVENGYDLPDRMRYLNSVLVARRFARRLSLQVTPMLAHANTVLIETIQGERAEQENTLLAVGLAGRIVLVDGAALTFEFVPVLGPASDGTESAFALGLDLETGGHVFQLFVATSNGLTEERMVATNSGSALRLGFNVNRVFAFGGN